MQNPKKLDAGISLNKNRIFKIIICTICYLKVHVLYVRSFSIYFKAWLVKKRLEQQGVTYQYLDGGTPQKQRKASVEEFQSGSGDLFLLSLKAGGVGLNLTAADYVIHLDPWWNPAIEDQASDRAHRLGQTRPVTVYRLVMKHSIEEKILKMHRDKRELAIGLLDDSEKSASLTEVDLLELISQASLWKWTKIIDRIR